MRAELRRKFRPKAAYAVSCGPGEVFLSEDDYGVDWESLKFVVADDAYRTDYTAAVVLDVGAHKGYYGAYAIAGGARAVLSFEPETGNVEFLERAAATYRARGVLWEVRQVAVAAEKGQAELHVMGGSWGHALHPPEKFAQYEVGTQRVPVEAMADVLAEADSFLPDGGPLVVKINVEGEECAIVLETPARAWEHVTEIFVETHPWATCTAADLAEHLAPAGLSKAPSPMAPVLRLRRAGAARSG
jgi:FkbM family methyltransferase